MMKQELIAKKALYEAKKVELSIDSHETEISEKVEAFRAQKEQEILDFEANLKLEFAAQKEADEKKIDNYLELLDELIEEATKQEALAAEAARTDVETSNT
jgi:glutaredoxin 2